MKKLVCVLALVAFAVVGTARADIYFDPVGDANPGVYRTYDIEWINATYNASTVLFTVTFTTTPLAPSVDPFGGLYGYIDIDTDQNSGTGAQSMQTTYGGGPSQLGDEYYIDLTTEASNPGNVAVLDQSGTPLGNVQIVFGALDITINVPLALISDDGKLNYGMILGDTSGPTDWALNPGDPLQPAASQLVPEPSSLALLGLACVGLLAYARKRKQ